MIIIAEDNVIFCLIFSYTYVFRIWQKFVLSVSIFVYWRNNCCNLTLDITYGGSSCQTEVSYFEPIS